LKLLLDHWQFGVTITYQGACRACWPGGGRRRGVDERIARQVLEVVGLGWRPAAGGGTCFISSS